MKKYVVEEVKHWTKKMTPKELKEKFKWLKTLHRRLNK